MMGDDSEQEERVKVALSPWPDDLSDIEQIQETIDGAEKYLGVPAPARLTTKKVAVRRAKPRRLGK